MVDLTGRRKRRKAKTRRSAVGAPPGELVAHADAERSRLRVMGIGGGRSQVAEGVDLSALKAMREAWPVVWVDLTGLADVELVRGLGADFGLHALALEDVVNTSQRPKCESFEDHAFVVMRMFAEAGEGGRGEVDSEQLSLFFGDGYVLTFQEREGDSFDPVRRRIERGAPRLHAGRADYLAYALIDAVVDGYFPLSDAQTARVDALEDEIFENVDAVQVPELHRLRRAMLQQKRYLRPTRDAVGAIIKLERPFVAEETKVFFGDVQDHCDQLIDINDTYRDTAGGLIDLHMTLSAAKTNEVINLLTFVSAIFIPLGFLAGLWGMNFDPGVSPFNMPELGLYYGYPMALGLMATIGLGLLFYFRKRRWL